MKLIVLGVCFEVFATLVGTCGKQLVSYATTVQAKQRARSFKVVGLLLTTLVGPVLDMAAYAFAPQAIVAPLSGLDIVWNTCSAPHTLGEKLSGRHLVGSGLVFFGAVATAHFGPHHTDQASLERMHNIFLGWRFLTYAAAFAACMLLSTIVLRLRPKGEGDKARGIALGLTAGGIAGNMYFISAGVGLLRASADSGDWSAWTNPLPYFVVLGAVVVAVTNIPFMTKALQEYEALVAVTMFEGSHIVVACISGTWVLAELDGVERTRRAVYWLCIATIVLGLLVIQSAAGSSIKPTKRDAAQLRKTSDNPQDADNTPVPVQDVENGNEECYDDQARDATQVAPNDGAALAAVTSAAGAGANSCAEDIERGGAEALGAGAGSPPGALIGAPAGVAGAAASAAAGAPVDGAVATSRAPP